MLPSINAEEHIVGERALTQCSLRGEKTVFEYDGEAESEGNAVQSMGAKLGVSGGVVGLTGGTKHSRDGGEENEEVEPALRGRCEDSKS